MVVGNQRRRKLRCPEVMARDTESGKVRGGGQVRRVSDDVYWKYLAFKVPEG